MDPNKYEYNLQSMSGDKTKSCNLELKDSEYVIISLSSNHNNNNIINHAIAKCGASAIEKTAYKHAVANHDILQVGSGKLSLRNKKKCFSGWCW